MKTLYITIFATILPTAISYAQITDAFRNENAVVLYRFQETTGDVKDTSKFTPAADLQIVYPAGVIRTEGVLNVTNANIIRSRQPVNKIYDQCRASNEMSIELWVENNENVERRSGIDSKRLNQPLRMISYSKGLFNRNFIFGQFYDMGNLYVGAINNAGVESTNEVMTDQNFGNSLRNPIMSDVAATIVPVNNVPAGMQKIYLTYKQNSAQMYLTDMDGRLYLHRPSVSNGFAGNFSTWRKDAYLTLANEYIPDANLSVMQQPAEFQSCNPNNNSTCATNPNRYWKGKFYLVAVYCKELKQEDIFGSGALQIAANPSFEINLNLQVTPSLLRAQNIYQRLTGTNTPIVNPILEEMQKKLDANDPVGASALATSQAGFYNIVLRDFAAKMSNRDETILTPLNDFTATIIGAVRDDVSAKRLLTDNLIYVGDTTKAAVPSNVITDILRSNNHYEALGNGRFDLSQVLKVSTQKLFNGTKVVDNPTPAGLLTSRQWMAAHAIAGTNRRLVEFTFREFLCLPMERVADSTGPDNVVGPDIDRFPGGSHTKYTSTCRACHTILDGFRPAFAHFTFSNNFVKHSFLVPSIPLTDDENTSMGMQQNPPYIAKKLNHNETVFPGGRIVSGDSWVNNAIYGSNKTTFNWHTTTQGTGIKAFGELISNSKQFPLCMAHRVFKSVCKREPASTDEQMLNAAAQEFSTSRNYNLKFLFQKIVTTTECLGGG